MTIKTVCVLGGSGFVGHHLVTLLAARGLTIRVPTRRREDAKDLVVLPGVEVIEADIHDSAALQSLLTGMDAIVNLVGILHESKPGNTDSEEARRGSFHHAHVKLPQKVVQACRSVGARRMLHMSALGADSASHSAYQRSKAEGEAVVSKAADANLSVTVFRPSVIFGPGDSFLNLFAQLLKFAPVVPLADATANFQPVYVADVARAFADALDMPETYGQTYNLCGPKVYTLSELVQLTARKLGMKRLIVPLGRSASYLFAHLMELKPGRKIMTRDNHYAMRADNVCPLGFPSLFGKPTTLESVIGYLSDAHPRQHYHGFRSRAGR